MSMGHRLCFGKIMNTSCGPIIQYLAILTGWNKALEFESLDMQRDLF